MQQQVYYISKLKDTLLKRQRVNSRYSLRAFAKDIDLHPSTLSNVIKGKRALPLKSAAGVVEKLSLSPKEKTYFMESLLRVKTNIDNIAINRFDDRFMLDESYYRIIAEWEHFAVLELFEIASQVNREVVASKFNITLERAESVLNNLLFSKLIYKDEYDNYQKTNQGVKTTEDVKCQALKESHKETLSIGIQKLDEIEVELRDFSSTTVAVDLEKLPEAKTIIREF